MAIRIREEFGLNSDPEWVRKVNDDPTSVMSDLGILVTPDELGELQANQGAPDDYSALIAYGLRHADQFGGLYLDNAAGHVVMLFTDDLDQHKAEIEKLPRGATVEVRQCTYTEAELRAIQDEIALNHMNLDGIQLMSVSVDVIRNVVVVEGKSNDPEAGSRLAARYSGKLVADIVPLPGPWANNAGGQGWRLVAAVERNGSWAYSVHAATSSAEWSALWAQLSPGLDEPTLDFENEIAVVFGEGIGSSCREVRLDDVVIDIAQARVSSRMSDPLAPRICTADLAGAAVFVVAVARAALPRTPFTLQLHDPLACCEDTGRIMVDSL